MRRWLALAGDGAMAVAAVAAPLASGADAGNTTPVMRHVVVAGIGGLRWSDVSAAATPVLWRLAATGSVGSLVDAGIHSLTCPADGWLTLNAGARAAVPHPAGGPCPASPVVRAGPAHPAGQGVPGPALIPRMRGLISGNAGFHYNPQWGLLARGAGVCATAAGRGAALALASPAGVVPRYLESPSSLTTAVLGRCPLTVIDLGNLPSAGGPAGRAARAAALRAMDAQLGQVRASLPPRAALIVAAPGDGSAPHLRAIVITGPGYAHGLLASASTRQPGIVLLTDLTPTVLHWLGRPLPAAVVGSPLRSVRRGSLPATVAMLVAQDTAAQVYRSTFTPFFLLAGFGYLALFALIAVVPWGTGESRRRWRRDMARLAGLWAAALPVGTVLASLIPWQTSPHPAVVLYSVAVAWAAAIASVAATGPWQREPLGSAGVVAAVTLGVLGLDLMTGSRLLLETPFGLSVLGANRFYGLDNNAVVIYAASGILSAAWLGGTALRRGSRVQAVALMAAVTTFAVGVAGWPGFGAKVGGTIAMLPGFLLLIAVAAGVPLTVRRVVLIVFSGAALVTVFAVINYLVPATSHSHLGGFVGEVLHGGAGGILRRKISSNLTSLTAGPLAFMIPVVVVLLGLIVGWPAWMRARLLVRAYAQVPLLKAAFSAIWLVGVLGWFAEDSGVTVPAAALPLVLPLAVVIIASVPGGGAAAAPAGQQADATAAGPAAQQGDATAAGLAARQGDGAAAGPPGGRAVPGPTPRG